MPDNIENGWGAQALDLNQQQRRYQNAIVSGCGASDGTNAMEIGVASGEAIVAGSRVSVSTTTLTLTSSNTDPRKDVIYIDSAGVPQVATGTAAPAAPSGETGRDTYQPQPPDLSATDAAVVAEVWVAGGTADTGSGDISDRRVFADIVAGSVDAQSVVSDTVSAVEAKPAQPRYQSYKSAFSWQVINWEDNGSAIIDGSSTGDNDAAWPSILHADSVLDSPIDDWYCYWSTHDQNYIALHTAPSPWGPWTYQSQVHSDTEGSQTASPWAVFDPERDRINLYYHTDPNFSGTSGRQHTRLATAASTGDGTSFSTVGTVLEAPRDGTWDEQERSYMRGVRVGRTFVAAYQGRDRQNNAKGIGLARSFDGEDFEKIQPQPAFDNAHWASNPWEPNTQGAAPSISLLGGELFVHFNDRTAVESRVLPLRDADAGLDQEAETVYTQQAWQSGTPAVQEFVSDGQYLYLVYYDETNAADRSVGIARAELGVDL